MADGLKIGDWSFEPELRQLIGPEGEVSLEPRTAAVLHDLSSHAGQLRSRQELLDSVWGEAFIGEAALTHCIWQLRKCFGDDARSPRYIQTVARSGYRLIAATNRRRTPVVRTLLAIGDEVLPTAYTYLLKSHAGSEVTSSDGRLVAFDRPVQAVRLALALQAREGVLPIGITTGEVRLSSTRSEGPTPLFEVQGAATAMAVRLGALADPGQILLTGSAFEIARQSPTDDGWADGGKRWLAYGPYQFHDLDEPVAVFEVGERGSALLRPPPDSAIARRGLGGETILGWRAAPGLSLPKRPHWKLRERCGEGGFGEVWLAQHGKTGERQVVKFCYDAARLRALQREVTIFRLIKEELGDRADICRIIDWNFDEAPYFLQLEYSACGSLVEWFAAQGGLSNVPLESRLRLIREAAAALAAAHSVGVLHKDIKPANILIYLDNEGRPHPRLTDFGISRLTDRARLDRAGVTALGLTATESTEPSRSDAGTRLYMAPELVEGRAATVQADIFALGVVLYQVSVGDLGRALAPGWERSIDDDLLREDIAAAVDGAPERRLASALELAERLGTHRQRRESRARSQHQRQTVERIERRKRWAVRAAVVLGLFAVMLGIAARQVSREAARANKEARAARRVSSFLGDLFRLAAPGEELSRSFTASDLLDQGVRRARTQLENQPRIRAALLNIIGEAYLRLDQHEKAGELIDQALELRRRHLGERHLEVAESLHAKAALLLAQSDLAAAEPFFLDGLDIRRELLGPRHLLTAKSLTGLANLRRHEGKPKVAEALYRQALEIRRERLGDSHVKVAAALSSLAASLRAQGRFDVAEPLYRQALAMRRELLGERHLAVAGALNNLAGLLRSRGDSQAAIPYLRQALDIRLEILGQEHLQVASSQNNLARALRFTGSHVEAEELFQRALALRRQLLGERHPRIAQTRIYLAELWIDRGDLTAAEQAAQESLVIFRAALGPNHWRVSHAESVLASAWTGLGRFAAAEPLLLAGCEALRESRGAGSLFAIEARERVAELYEAWGRPAEAKRYRSDHPPAAQQQLELLKSS